MTSSAAVDHDMRSTDAPVARRRTPLVGYVATGNTIDVVETHDRLIVRLSRGTQRFLLLAATLFGPVATLMLWLHPAGLNPHTPAVIKGVFYAVIAGSWVFLLYAIMTRPRFEIAESDGDIVYFRRGGRPSRVIHRRDIAGVTIDEDAYISGEFRTVNRVLSAVLKNGEVVRLCASSDFELIASLAGKVAARTHTKLLNSTNGQVTE